MRITKLLGTLASLMVAGLLVVGMAGPASGQSAAQHVGLIERGLTVPGR